MGCLLGMILVPLSVVVLIFFGASLGAKEWADARPAHLTEAKWTAKRMQCEAADLGPSACATTSDADVRRIAAELADERRQELCTDGARASAVQQAQQAVSDRLRAPSTADFLSSSVRATRSGCDWIVSGEVDAQNAFGGTVRSSYRAKVRPLTSESWLPLEVSVN